MALSHDLIAQFAKVVKGAPKKNTESTVYGTVVTDGNGNKYVKLDGSDQLTPLTDDNRPSAESTTTSANEGERVSVLIKNHTATVTGNISSPAVRSDDFNRVDNDVKDIKKFDIAVVEQLQAQGAYIKKLQTDKAEVGDLTAATARISELEADNVTIKGDLKAAKATVDDLKVTKIDADVANTTFATIKNLDASNAEIDDLKVNKAGIEDLKAANAEIENLKTNKLDANEAELKYANIDFGNITDAAIKKVFSDSGIIKDLIVSEGKITGELVGVTIKGDLIEGGTVKADKLVILGENGLYYKLNVDSLGETTAKSDPKYQSGLDGSVLIKKSIVAEKIAVDDLVAFGATIGGFHIGDHSLYSGVKSSAANTTRGVFFGDDGQFAVGDSNNFVKYYKDSDGNYKLAISADSLVFSSSSKTVEETINDVKKDVDNLRDEITTLLRIESSRGTVFKNDQVSTILSVVIYHGKQRITDSDTMHLVFGNGAYLQWKWQRLEDDEFGLISATDKRLGDNGFKFILSPEDVDTKVTFMCELITDDSHETQTDLLNIINDQLNTLV